jgi:DNA-binding transcriptional LysR family regulator
MEIQQVRYFLSICEHGGFSRAAERCDVTQPALTAAIKRLERDVGGELFYREGRRLVLTELGKLVKPHLQRLVEQRDSALEVARNFRLLRATPLRIGVTPTIGPAYITPRLAAFRGDCPGIELAVGEMPVDTLLRQLEANELDVGIASVSQRLPDAFRSERLFEERYVVAFAIGHRFASCAEVTLHDTSGEAYVDRLACEMRDQVMATCRAAGVELYASVRSDREEWVQAMVQAGMGIAFLPEHAVCLPGVLARPLVSTAGVPAVSREVVALEVRGRPRSQAARRLLDAVGAPRNTPSASNSRQPDPVGRCP